MNVKNKDLINKYNEIKSLPYSNIPEMEERILKKLNILLNTAYSNIEYYNDLFKSLDIVKNNRIELHSFEDFQKIPLAHIILYA